MRGPLLAMVIAAFLMVPAICAGSEVDASRKSVQAGDVLYTQQGGELLGTLINAGSEKVSFEVEKKGLQSFALVDVLRVEFKLPGEISGILDDIDDDELKEWISSAPTAEEMPGRPYVVLYSGHHVTEQGDGSVKVVYRGVFKILNERGKSVGNRTEWYFPDNQEFKILTSRSIMPDGKVSSLPHTSIKHVRPYLRYRAYDRMKKVVYAVPNAEVGAVIEIVTEHIHKKDGMDNPGKVKKYWASTAPTLRAKLIFDRPENADYAIVRRDTDKGRAYVRYLQGKQKVYGRYPTGIIEENTVVKNGRAVTTWEAGPLPVFEEEPYSLNSYDLAPSICITKKRTWEKVAGFYRGEFESRLSLSGKAAEFAEDVVKGKKGLKAARALYNALVFEVNYLNLRPIYYSHLPHHPDEIFENGYANGWDKTFLYYAMLRHVGIEADLLAARPWNWYIRSKDPPSIMFFSSLVVRIKSEGRTVYANCTKDSVPFGELPGGLWNGMSLEIIGQTGKYARLPKLDPGTNYYERHITIRIDRAGDAKVEDKRQWRGPSAHGNRWTWKYPKSTLDKKYKEMVRKILPNARLVSYDLFDRKNLDEQVAEALVYDVSPLSEKSAGGYMTFALPGARYSPAKTQKYKRRFDMWFGSPWKNVKTYEIIPDKAVSVQALPDPVTIDGPNGGFDRAVQKTDDGRIIIRDTAWGAGYSLPVDKYSQYIQYRLGKQKAGRQEIIFKLPD